MTATKTPGRYYTRDNTVDCPDCGFPADAEFGDHGGDCRDLPPERSPWQVGADLIHKWAVLHRFLSINDLRVQLETAGVRESSFGRSFRLACERQSIEKVGTVPAHGSKRPVNRYRSLVFEAAA